jgi:tetratricopeptide (TPR) repeat protein
MPLTPSNDFGSKDFDGSGVRKIHNHLFPAANTGLPWLLSLDPAHKERIGPLREAVRTHADFLRGTAADGSDKKLRIDLFGIKAGDGIRAPLVAPLRPNLPALKPGQTYLVEVVIRTLNVGHVFTQGTADSNEVWVDFQARSGNRIIGRSGALQGKDDTGPLDEEAHRINALVLDRHGRRINRRNPQDIFTPLYDHQIPPGAAQVVHYLLPVPSDIKAPIELTVKVRYRKFDFEYMSLVHGGADKVPKLPIVDLCYDRVVLPVEGVKVSVPAQSSPIKPPWQRWNDYGIACLIEGGVEEKKGELRQAEQAFAMLTGKDVPPEAHAHGYLNLARVYEKEGRLAEAARALNQARTAKPPAPWWTVAWLNGLVNEQNARTSEDFDTAISNFERILDPANQPRQRKFDFTRDYVIQNKLGSTLFKRAQFERNVKQRDAFLLRAITAYQRTLAIDPENMDAHYGLSQCYTLLAEARPEDSYLDTPGTQTDLEHLQALGGVVCNDKKEKEERLRSALQLHQALTALGKEANKAWYPKRPRFDAVLAQLQPCFHKETDPQLRGAVAYALAGVHLQLYAIYRPDELARGRATGRYRAKHLAASRAAEPIVIYSLK